MTNATTTNATIMLIAANPLNQKTLREVIAHPDFQQW
jgi:hypothetical protein